MKNKKFLIGVLAVLLIVALSAGVTMAKKPKVEENLGGFKDGIRINTETVKKGELQTEISSSGKLEAKDTHVIYAEASNKIIGIHKKIGDAVKKGEVILTLDTDTQQKTQKQLETLALQLKASEESLGQLVTGGTQSEILAAQSAVVQTQKNEQDARDLVDTQKTNLENVQRDFKNQKKDYEVATQLFSEGLISQKEMDDEKTKWTSATQKLESTQTAIASAQKSIEAIAIQKEAAEYNLGLLLNQIQDPNKKQKITAKQAEIKNLQTQIFNSKNDLKKSGTQVMAPIDGIITQVPTEEGMPIASGAALVKILDPSKLIIKCAIAPYYAADLKVDLSVKIKYTGSTTIELEGKVTKVLPVNADSTNIPIEIEVLNPNNAVGSGFVVDIKIITNMKENVFMVPVSATIKDTDDTTYVFVIKEDGTLEKRKVTPGVNNGTNVEVDDVTDGEVLAANPAGFLKEGMKVSYSLPSVTK